MGTTNVQKKLSAKNKMENCVKSEILKTQNFFPEHFCAHFNEFWNQHKKTAFSDTP